MSDDADRAPRDDSASPDASKKKRRRRRKKRSSEGAPESTSNNSSSPDHGHDRGPDRPRRDRDDRHSGDGRKRKRKRSRTRRDDAEVEPERHRTRTPAVHTAESFELDKTFADLGLKEDIVSGIEALGFKHPTKIQAELIPVAITGKDVLGQAKTGTGKTAAFAIPLLQLVEKGKPFQALILGPTRELAIQIRQDIDELGAHTGLKAVAVYGGQSINTQADKLARHPEIIVGTPGRVMDMVQRGHMRFDTVKFAVLDEVDRMFDIGFRDDIRKILSQCPTDRQTIFVSATITDEIERLARKHMRNPEKLVITSGSLTVDLVEQHYLTVEPWDKRRLLAHLLTHEEPALTLVFCRMKRTVDDVVRSLARHDIQAHAIHGDLSQGARNRVMDKFRSGDLAVLVASDLASRGLDVENISHVVNYDLPDDPDLYVHRIGRTARAGRRGVAWSLVTPEQGKLLTQIELLINAEIPKLDYPDFDHRERPSDWKDEPKPNQYIVEGVERKEHKPRHEIDDPAEIAKKLSDEELAKKFPGGVIPKLPPKRLGGRMRTGRK
ncbi:MAG: DEAD/DEAH box helicase [Phycisphaerales bacterium]